MEVNIIKKWLLINNPYRFQKRGDNEKLSCLYSFQTFFNKKKQRTLNLNFTQIQFFQKALNHNHPGVHQANTPWLGQISYTLTWPFALRFTH